MDATPRWLRWWKFDDDFEEAEDATYNSPNFMLEVVGRHFIQKFALPIKVRIPYGATGQIARLCERYLKYKALHHPNRENLTKWINLWRGIIIKKKLIIAVCIKIIFRTYDYLDLPSVIDVRPLLLAHNECFPALLIETIEKDILISAGLKIPPMNNRMKAEKLASYVGFNETEIRPIATISEICDLYFTNLNELCTYGRMNFEPEPKPGILFEFAQTHFPMIRSNHLAAATVIATRVHLQYVMPDPTKLLASWFSIDLKELERVESAILTLLSKAKKFSPDEIRADAKRYEQVENYRII